MHGSNIDDNEITAESQGSVSIPDDQSLAAERAAQLDIRRVARNNQNALVVMVYGEIDLLTLDRFRQAVTDGLGQLREEELLVIDLTQVTFLGSPALQVLIDLTAEAQDRRRLLRLIVGHVRAVTRPIAVTGLDAFLPLCHDIEEAFQFHGPTHDMA